jgi:hypothetical protein
VVPVPVPVSIQVSIPIGGTPARSLPPQAE